jgi:CheY-like chemotaxis protein
MVRILWIEEEAKIELIQYKKPLVREGYLVDIAPDATEAIERLKSKVYDVLIFDLIIPYGANYKVDKKILYVGLFLLQQLLEGKIPGILKEYSHEEVIVFSAVNDQEIHDQIEKLKVKRVLHKRLNKLTVLKEKVDEIVQ